MIINSINTESITPVEYNHMHDSTLVYRKYRENFDFGLTVDQYYFNKAAKDKKTNYNTQYVLSELQPLSTVLELKIPYTKAATESFTTTVKFGEKYLKTDFTEAFNYTGNTATGGVSSISSTFVASTEFSNLSTNFFFTFTLTSTSPLLHNLLSILDSSGVTLERSILLSSILYLKVGILPETAEYGVNHAAVFVAEAAVK